MLQIVQNKQLAASFPGVKCCGESHNYMTQSTTKKLLHIPTNRTDRYGKQSAKYNFILDWEEIQKIFSWCKSRSTFPLQIENSHKRSYSEQILKNI